MGRRRGRTNWQRELGDPYAEGFDAAEAGLSGTKNPYPENTEAYTLWLAGWIAIAEDQTIDVDDED